MATTTLTGENRQYQYRTGVKLSTEHWMSFCPLLCPLWSHIKEPEVWLGWGARQYT